MPEVELRAGTIEYQDVGAGPIVVLAHGLAMDGAQWRHVVADLRSDYRCVLPTLPLGAHRRPMRPDADLSLRGLGHLLAQFLQVLDLRDVTLCFNDWCGAQVNDRRRANGAGRKACAGVVRGLRQLPTRSSRTDGSSVGQPSGRASDYGAGPALPAAAGATDRARLDVKTGDS
jgi:hypothetical protein